MFPSARSTDFDHAQVDARRAQMLGSANAEHSVETNRYAGWWQRVLASIVDSLVLGVLTAAVAIGVAQGGGDAINAAVFTLLVGAPV